MGYCKNCGAKLKDGAHFCKECGQSVTTTVKESKPVEMAEKSNEPIQDTQKYSERNSERNTNGKRKRMNLKLIIALFIVVLLGGTYYYFDKIFYSPEKVFEGFANAIDAKDINKVKSYINNGQREMKATDEQTETFINYLNDNPKVYSELYTSLKSEADFYTSQRNSLDNTSELSNIANLKTNGKKWGVFDDYVIEVKPYYVNVISDYDNTMIQVDDKEIGNIKKDQENTFGPFLPGEHSIKAVIDGDYGKVSQIKDFNDSNLVDRTTSVEFDWSDYFFEIYTNREDAILFVNGKSTKKVLKDIEILGPVPLDESIKVHAEAKVGNKTIKSDTVTIKDEMYNVELYFDEDVNETVEGQEENENSKEEESVEVDESVEASKIEGVIHSHYEHITNDNFEAAYNLFSSEKRSKLSFKDWSKGLKANQGDQVNVVNVKEVNDATAIAYVEMTSYDDNEDGTTLVQKWGGNWYLVKENGNWYLNKAKLSKLSSKTES